MAERETTLHLTRWSVSSGSNVRSRGVVVIEAGDHHWRGAAERLDMRVDPLDPLAVSYTHLTLPTKRIV